MFILTLGTAVNRGQRFYLPKTFHSSVAASCYRNCSLHDCRSTALSLLPFEGWRVRYTGDISLRESRLMSTCTFGPDGIIRQLTDDD